MTAPYMNTRYPRQAVKLARLYGWTPEQVARLPLEVFDLLCSLPDPPPPPKPSRTRRVWKWFTKPTTSLADLVLIAGIILAINTLYLEAHLPWWATFLVVDAIFAAGIFGASFIRSFVKSACLSLRRRP